MPKNRTQFLCNSCGSVHPKWMGKCPDCGAWDALEEYKAPTADPRAASRTPGGAQTGDLIQGAAALTLDEIDEAEASRQPTGIGEFDRVLGGGVVPGSAVLVGGEPGIGKSTLLLQVARELAAGATERRSDEATKGAESASSSSPSSLRRPVAPSLTPAKVLYVTSEES